MNVTTYLAVLHKRAIKKLKLAFFIFIFNLCAASLFAIIYANLLNADDWDGLDATSTWLDYIYFSLSCSTTIGFGNISPKSQRARAIVIIQQIFILFELCVFLL